MRNYDLAIAYRIYPKVAKLAMGLPAGDDKLRFSELCLRSFKEALGDLRVKLWVLLDGCPEEYADLFLKYFEAQDLEFIRLPGIGNQATFGRQIDILLGQEGSNLVYFAEDDYVYLPGQFERMLRFLRSGREVDFVTPYDHPDCYELDLHREPKRMAVFEGHHWRTAASTCLTFLTRKSTLARYERTLRTYSLGNNDCAMWLSLTKRRLFHPLLTLKFLIRGEFYWKVILKAWLYGWRQNLFGATARLWVPVPGLATHACAGLMSPAVDWISVMRSHLGQSINEEPHAQAAGNACAEIIPEIDVSLSRS
jgi:hypothetical protein